jgi:serine/threonine-protein kinase
VGCPDQETLLAVAEGRFAGDRSSADSHVESCATCRTVLQTLARSTARANDEELREGVRIGRYRLRARLGQGGMGLVFRAEDLALGRDVALKFVAPALSGDVSMRARLQREAQTAAALDHPRIGAVYEIGDYRGRPYLVMAYYEGETLRQRLARGPLAPDDAVRVLGELADALAAAHGAGVIHRDVKPSNVILTEAGLKVVDFGIAKWAVGDESLTRTGELVGTLAYMSPEQLRGASVDERADVWSFGVLAYEALTGVLPFQGTTPSAMLAAVLDGAARPPRERQADIPGELETVLLHCLEPNPADRYPSARELAADLSRSARGERVQARRPGLARRLHLRKHRLPIVVVLTALLAIAAVASRALVASRRQAAQARRSRALALEAERIRSILENAYLLPLHDTRPERDDVGARLRAIERELPQLDEERGIALYALGVGYVGLGELERARAPLEQAWQAGEHGPDESYLLGYVLSQLYADERNKARTISDEARRRARESQLEKELRDPARERLRQAAGAAHADPDLIEALIALTEWRYEDAIRAATASLARHPSRYDAGRIAATATLWRDRMATAVVKEDQRAATLQGNWRNLEVEYRRLTDVGRSDSSLYLAEARDLLQVALTIDHEDEYRAVIEVVERGLMANVDDARLWEVKAQTMVQLANAVGRRGGDPRPSLADARVTASRALLLDPEQRDGRAHEALGSSWMAVGMYEVGHGVDPRPSLAKADSEFSQAARVRPGEELYNFLGIVAGVHAAYNAARGVDPEALWSRAEEYFHRSIDLYGGSPTPYINLGFIANDRAGWMLRHGHDPRAAADVALRAFADAQKVMTGSDAFTDSVSAYVIRARYERATGGDARPWLARAYDSGEQALRMEAHDASTFDGLAAAHAVEADVNLGAGKDPRAAVAAARGSAEAALAVDANDAAAYLAMSAADLVDARYALASARNPAAMLRHAEQAAARAIALDGNSADGPLAAAKARRWTAESLRRRRADASGAIAAGLEQADAALAIDASLGEALAVRAALLALRGGDGDAQLAHATLARALRLNPLLVADYGR